MKLKFETRSKALKGCSVPGHACYSGWQTYSTSAKTPEGIVKRMKQEARDALARRIRFYENHAAGRKMDVYDENHVWHFHTYAPCYGHVIRFEAFCFFVGGAYGEIEFVTVGLDNTNDEWSHYKERVDHYESLVAYDGF